MKFRKLLRLGIVSLAPVILGHLGAGARIELKTSPLFMPVYSSGQEFDEFDNQKEDKKDKKEKQQYKGKTELETQARSFSKTKAVLLSLILPGAGHYYIGETGRAEAFMGAEAVAWAGVFAFRTYGQWKEDDYIRYAEEHAGIDPTGKDDNFFKNLTFYGNRHEYNTSGRIIEPSAPYYPNTASYYWQWDSRDARAAYRAMRNSSKSAFRKTTFMIGVAVFNRIFSSIDAFRMAKKVATPEEKDEFSSTQEKLKFKFKANPFGHNPSVGLTVTRQF